ncbi:hypothetical protein BH09MYX1_BH09MYX1_47450 [soil metagenome]
MKKLLPLVVFASLPLGYFACGGGDKPADAPTTTTSASASTDTAAPAMSSAPVTSAAVVPPAASSSAPATPTAPVGTEKTVEAKWELVTDTMCKAPEKHVRLRMAEATAHFTDLCSGKLADELAKKKPKTIKATFLVYRNPESSSICDVDGFVKGDRLPKTGCSFPTGWGEAAGGGVTGNSPGPNPLFK